MRRRKMADVLSVIQDVLNQDKQQKKEQAKIMREVQKKLKEKEAEELPEKTGDKEEYTAFVNKTLKQFGVKSPAELKGDERKRFYDALDAGWEADDEKPEPEDEETELGDRVKARMKAEQEEEDDIGELPDNEDEDPVGDNTNPDKEDEVEEDDDDDDEPSEEQIDKIADLVVQKLKDKADEEEAEEEEPDATEAEAGKTEKVDTKPKMEDTLHLNPHRKSVWAEALQQVHENTLAEALNHPGAPEFGRQLIEYAKQSGGIDAKDFMRIGKDAMEGTLPHPKALQKMDTDPRDHIYDIMAKNFGWKMVEKNYGIRFHNKRDYVEEVQLGEHNGAKPHKHPHDDEEEVKEDWIDDEARKVERKWKRMSKQEKTKWRDKIDDLAAKHKMSDAELEDILDDYGLHEDLDQSADVDTDDGIISRKGSSKPPMNDSGAEETEDRRAKSKPDATTKAGKPAGSKGPIGKSQPDAHIDSAEKGVKKGVNEDLDQGKVTPGAFDDSGDDENDGVGVITKKSNPKPPVNDSGAESTEDRRAKSKPEAPTKSGKSAKPGKGGDLDKGTITRIEGDSQNKHDDNTPYAGPVKAVGKATAAKAVDPDYGKGEKGHSGRVTTVKEKLENWGINTTSQTVVNLEDSKKESIGVTRARKHYQKEND